MDIYEKFLREQKKKNKEDFIKNIDSKENIKKISKYAKENGYSIEEVKEELKKSSMLVDFFATNPTKQNWYEKIAIQEMKKINGIKNIKQLPKNGKNSKYLVNGQIIEGKMNLMTKEHTKSIDFEFDYYDYKIYATHKYTKESGGSQDNQYKDVINFIENSIKNSIKNIIFVVIVDGKYYDNVIGKTKIGKREELENRVKNTNTIITSIETLKEKLDLYIKNN